MAQVGSFLRANAVVLRSIILSVALAYASFALLYINWVWRDHVAYYVGGLVFLASFPWTPLWLMAAEPYVSSIVPGYAVAATRVLVVGVGAGVNVATFVAIARFIAARGWRAGRNGT